MVLWYTPKTLVQGWIAVSNVFDDFLVFQAMAYVARKALRRGTCPEIDPIMLKINLPLCRHSRSGFRLALLDRTFSITVKIRIQQVLGLLSSVQRAWLIEALTIVHPTDPWLGALMGHH